jgi:hypothetical protein
MSALLDQCREAWQRTIKENPETIIVYRKAKVSNGFGGMIDDPFGAPVGVAIRIRLSHIQKAGDGPGPGGIAEDLGRYIMSDWKTIIYRDDIFEAIGKTWRVGIVDTIIQHGGIVGYRAPVIEASEIEAAT